MSGCNLSGNVVSFFPEKDDPYLRFVVRCKIITETISIPLNFLLLFFFIYLHKKQLEKLLKKKKRSYSLGMKSRSDLNQSTIILTYLLLIFGAIFSVSQGFFENFALNNCADIVNTYIEFFFYIGHRVLLLLIYLNRLYMVFGKANHSTFLYPKWFFILFLLLIIISGIISFISHILNMSIMKVPSHWDLWNDSQYVCAWQFGSCVTQITRPFDFSLNIMLLLAFVWKLYQLNRYLLNNSRNIISSQTNSLNISTSADTNAGDLKTHGVSSIQTSTGHMAVPVPSESKINILHTTAESTSFGDVSSDGSSYAVYSDEKESIKSADERTQRVRSPLYLERKQRKIHTNLEILAMRMTVLTAIATISSLIVTGGYLGYHVRIIGALWPFDIILNSICCVLMFKFTNFTIYPCFGENCDRCCCFNCVGCRECEYDRHYCEGKCKNNEKNHVQQRISTSKKENVIGVELHIEKN